VVNVAIPYSDPVRRLSRGSSWFYRQFESRLFKTVPAFLAGCVSNVAMNASLTELGQSSATVYGSNGILVQRVISINGLSTEDAPGTLSRNVDQLPVWQRRIFGSLNPIPGDLPDGMSPRLLPARPLSRLSVRDYPSTIELN
jgi:hypothetical protein